MDFCCFLFLQAKVGECQENERKEREREVKDF